MTAEQDKLFVWDTNPLETPKIYRTYETKDRDRVRMILDDQK